MAAWQPASSIPRDGTMFLFRPRSLATAELMDPLVGRYNGEVLEINVGVRWEGFGYPLVYWAELPEYP